MAQMSQGFMDRIRDAGAGTDRTSVKAYSDPWDVWVRLLQFQADLDSERSRPAQAYRYPTPLGSDEGGES